MHHQKLKEYYNKLLKYLDLTAISLSHLVIWSSSHLVNMVIWSYGHLIIWPSVQYDHLVI